MKKKRILALIMMLALVFDFFSFTGLEVFAEEKLAAPTNLRWEDGVAKWDAVEGASCYMVGLAKNGNHIYQWFVEDNQNDLKTYINTNYNNLGPGAYTFSVCAFKSMDDYQTASEGRVSEPWNIKKLLAPKNLRWDGTKCVWDKVEGAGFYWINIKKDDKSLIENDDFGSLTNSYDLSERVFKQYGNGIYKVSVCAFNSAPGSENFDNGANSDWSNFSTEYMYVDNTQNDDGEYNIILDEYLTARIQIYNEKEDCYEAYSVSKANPGDRIIIGYEDEGYNSLLPQGKFVKDIKCSGVDSSDDEFIFNEGSSLGASIFFVMPENDVSFSSVLGDTEEYIIDLSKESKIVNETIEICFLNSDYNKRSFSWKYEDNNDYIDIDSDGIWDIKYNALENDYEKFEFIKNTNTNLSGIIKLTPSKDSFRPNYYISINFGEKNEGKLDNTTSSKNNYASATISNSLEELKNNILAKEDIEKLETGIDVKIWLDVDDISTTVAKTDKDKVEASKPKGYSVASYLNIDL